MSHIGELTPDPSNRRRHNPRNVGMLVDALQMVGASRSIVIDEDGVILAGNGVVEAASEAGLTKLQVVEADGETIVAVRRRGLTAEQKRALAIYDNRTAELAEWNVEQLAADLKNGEDLSAFFLADELKALGIETGEAPAGDPRTLADRFGVPPFSVLDARQGYWQDRKRAWLALGIQSELGRGGLTWVGGNRTREDLDDTSRKILDATTTGTSIFDPVLCELVYRWFCPPDGVVLDPFAGGSVRGIVASKLGRQYLGIDLRPEQLAANREQAAAICDAPVPIWIEGDAVEVAALVPGIAADLVFSCPPYADLEVYSDDPRDLSTLEYDAFRAKYRAIIAACVGLLKPDRFACFVVGDVRDRKGFYRRLISDTEQAFEDAGARLYNEAVLVTAVGSLPIRIAKQFEGARKLGKTHQNVLVFCNGDPKLATQAIGPIEFGTFDEDLTT